jgi:putative NAD(P)-binding protein
MAGPPRILIAGGSGVFGRLLAQELLASTPAHVALAGRDSQRLAAACRGLGAPARTEGLTLDLQDARALGQAAAGCFAVACAAGPFQQLPPDLPRAALEAGAHWLDIGDDRRWVLCLLADAHLDGIARDAGLAVMPGLSTVPALSGVLVRWCRERLPRAHRARVTLFIGNRNGKGAGAIASALGGGFSDPVPVDLPIGRRLAYRLCSPDAALLREELALDAEFRVAFELPQASRAMAAAAAVARQLGPRGQAWLARGLSRLSAPFNHLGSRVSYLQAELWDASGDRASACLVDAGQRLAVLPCALALEALLSGELCQRGLVRPAAWLPPDEWVARLQTRKVGFLSRCFPCPERG